MTNAQISPEQSALEWLITSGVDECLVDVPVDRTVALQKDASTQVRTSSADADISRPRIVQQAASHDLVGAHDLQKQAAALAAACETLEALKQAITNFDGLDVKKTATQIVFADGNPNSKIMVIGEAPGADEDRQGKPFVGVSGQLLDKILACIGLSREEEDINKSVYISNILNWRPPGNRTPTASEMAIALPFIERHIQLAKPEILILCGGVSAKTLLKSSETISRLRGKFHDYQITPSQTIKAIATYHPSYLLRTPSQKKLVWQDMLKLQAHLQA